MDYYCGVEGEFYKEDFLSVEFFGRLFLKIFCFFVNIFVFCCLFVW